jgi:hypothetical protein
MNKKYIFASLVMLPLLAASCGKKVGQGPAADSGVQITPEQNAPTTIKVAPPSTTHGYYTDYSDDAIAGVKASKSKIVLFFYSDSFAPCKTTDINIQLHPEKIPPQTFVLKVDIKDYPEVVKKYNAIAPLQFIQIDANDKVLAQWISEDLDLIAKNMK